MRLRRSGRTAPAVVVAVACLLAGGVLTGAEAQPSLQLPNLLHGANTSTASSGQQSATRTATSPAEKEAFPPVPPGPGWTALYGLIDKTNQTVKKAKVRFDVPALRVFAYIQAITEQPVDPVYNWADSKAEIYVQSPKNTRPAYGVFPTAKTQVLGFGAVPVTADVHITQAPSDTRYPTPFKLKFRFTYSFNLTPPTPQPCGTQCGYTESPKVEGKVDVRIDNVKVDGVPVDVGRNCHTASLASLNVSAPAGYYPQQPPYPENLYIPFFGGGTLTGTVDVPSFTGCMNGSEDLSPLITGMVSGPDNAVTIHQEGKLSQIPQPLPR